MPEHAPDHDLLIRLDEKVTGMVTKLDKFSDDHESRIRALEKWRWYSAGLGATGGSIIATIVERVLHH